MFLFLHKFSLLKALNGEDLNHLVDYRDNVEQVVHKDSAELDLSHLVGHKDSAEQELHHSAEHKDSAELELHHLAEHKDSVTHNQVSTKLLHVRTLLHYLLEEPSSLDLHNHLSH